MSRRSGRSKTTADSPKPSKTESSPELDEQDEITRCVCGSDEISAASAGLPQFILQKYHIKVDSGLFIQCDNCLAWQHGFCVGLFTNDDVPDKYWCEQCKPGLHIIISDPQKRSKRTLYRPVNDGRKDLIQYFENLERLSPDQESKQTRLKSRRSPPSAADPSLDTDSNPTVSNRQSRKDRRHAEDAFDEQLQRALRESAKVSLSIDKSDDSTLPPPNGKKRAADQAASSTSKRSHSEDLGNEQEESNVDDESQPKAVKRETPRNRVKLRGKPKSRGSSSKLSDLASTNDPANPLMTTKEELLSQPSQPRYVNEKSTIYELRKRTGAILEWLGRTQIELEEERDEKTLQLKESKVEGIDLVAHYDENLKLMEGLTEKILGWEQKFGKYAPLS